MTIRHPRFLITLLMAGVPFLIAGLFVYRNSLPEPGQLTEATVHPARYVFLISSMIPAAGSILLALLLQSHLLTARRSREESKARYAQTLTAIALVPVLWAAIFATEYLQRSLFLSLWDSTIRKVSPMGASSILMGVAASIIIVALSVWPTKKLGAA